MSFGAWQSYQTGIHHKSTPSPELRQLLAAQCYGEAGEQSARHQVEQGGLAHLHHSQRHEGDEQTDAVRYHERGTENQRGAVNNANVINIHELAAGVKEKWHLFNTDVISELLFNTIKQQYAG